jgi:hypothetical protein
MQNHDPRPDLTTDSHLWHWLLVLAYPGKDVPDETNLYGALRGLRSEGAAIIEYGQGYRLDIGEMDIADYNRERDRWLLPHRERMTNLLRQLKDVVPTTGRAA